MLVLALVVVGCLQTAACAVPGAGQQEDVLERHVDGARTGNRRPREPVGAAAGDGAAGLHAPGGSGPPRRRRSAQERPGPARSRRVDRPVWSHPALT